MEFEQVFAGEEPILPDECAPRISRNLEPELTIVWLSEGFLITSTNSVGETIFWRPKQ